MKATDRCFSCLSRIGRPGFLHAGRVVFLVLVLAFLPAGRPALSGAPDSPAGASFKRIVIDPGHGGNDHGVTGPGGITEKRVMLEIARRMSERLSDEYAVFLTRSGDYNADSRSRTSLANRRRADAFVSLHAGGSRNSGVSGWAVYYHRHDNGIPAASGFRGSSGGGRDPVLWHALQERHVAVSAKLAETIRSHLEAGAAGEGVAVTDAPLAVLAGANMPAVLVEAGHLTHPVTAGKYSQESFIDAVASDIARGIRAFFEE